ncbi:MAG TPA: endonuclease/exonuclease/phosphatase family protein [Chthoniobacterales bacterium]
MKRLVVLVVTVLLVFAVQSPAREVTLMAWNLANYIRMDRTERGQSVRRDAPKPENEIRALIGIIASVKPDILGVCEMGKPEEFKSFLDRLKTAGLDYPYTEYVDGPDDERHVALASRFPIVARNSQANLSFELNGSRQFFKRGILDVTIEIDPAYRLRLLGTHLKSRREVVEDEALLRRNEARLLRAHVRGILAGAPDENLLVYGDMNDTKDQPPIREIMGPKGAPDSLQDINLKDQYGDKWTHWWKFADEYSRIDYVFMSRGVRPEVVFSKCYVGRPQGWNEASDHRPLVVVIRGEERAR